MKIYMIRHGKAEDFADSDFDRALTIEGKIELNEIFDKFVKEVDLSDYRIYSSPKKRTVETAEILCSKLKKPYEILDVLEGFNTDSLLSRLDETGFYKFILITHQPYISKFIYDITNEEVKVKKGSIHFIDTLAKTVKEI